MARRQNRRKDEGFSGWVGVLAGLALGLAVAAWVYQSGGLPGKAPETESSEREKPKAAPAKPAAKADAPSAEDPTRFEFYDLLPDAEVTVPEDEAGIRPGGPSAPLERPGAYVIQAGAFPNFAEADAVKARLALLGVKAEIQKVTVDDRTFHRVRVGPIENLDELNRLRNRLRQNKLDFLVIQVSE